MQKIKIVFSQNQLKILMKYFNIFLHYTYIKAYIKMRQIASQEMELPIVLHFLLDFFFGKKNTWSSSFSTFSSNKLKHALLLSAEHAHSKLLVTRDFTRNFINKNRDDFSKI